MKERYRHELPLWARLLGCWAVQDNSTLWRLKWGEISFSKRFHFALNYSAGDEVYPRNVFNIKIPGVCLFIYPPWRHVTNNPAMETPKWGFYTMEDALWFWWGKKKKVWYYPWSWSFVRHSQLMKDGTWYTYGKKERSWEKKSDDVFTETHPYTYVLKNGTVQKREATIYVEEREWRWLWLKKLPWPRKTHRTIDVKFNDEVGERTGSWEGGTVGCGYRMKDGETPLMTLRRMEKERTFR